MNSDGFQPIQIKANRDGFILVPDPEASFPSIMAYIEQKLRESRSFFQRSDMILDLRERSLRTNEIAALHHVLAGKAGVKLVEVKMADDVSFVLGNAPSRPLPSPAAARFNVSHASEGSHIVVRSTCRSGTRIESSADCIVLGDVNPGAEIIAVGDVIIFGLLKGIAHAGATGNRSARIWALSIEPSQIRIADLVALPPRSNKATRKRYEIAEVQEGMIEVITF